jgi:hypothetical protein
MTMMSVLNCPVLPAAAYYLTTHSFHSTRDHPHAKPTAPHDHRISQIHGADG